MYNNFGIVQILSYLQKEVNTIFQSLNNAVWYIQIVKACSTLMKYTGILCNIMQNM